MLKKFGQIFSSGSKPSRTEQLEAYDLSNRPFTRALLLRAAETGDENEQWLKDTFRHHRPIKGSGDLNEQVASAICMATFKIVVDAMEDAIGHAAFLPYEPLPWQTQFVVAFGFMVISGMSGPLEQEDYKLDINEASADLVNALLIVRPTAEAAEVFESARMTFREMLQADMPNVVEWKNNLRTMTQVYVIQFTTQKDHLKKQNIWPIFGSLLKTMLSAVEARP